MRAMRWMWIVVIAAGLTWSVQAQPPDVEPPVGPAPQEGLGPEFQGPAGIEPPQMLGQLVQLMEQVRQGRQDLLDELKQVLEQNRNATQEQRRAAAEAWRQENAQRLQEQRELATQLRLRVREWARANRPELPNGPGGPSDDGELTEPQYQQLMAQIRNRHQEQIRVNQDVIDQLEAAGSAQERQEIANQYRAQRMDQIQERLQEWQARAVQLDREESLAALRLQLRETADQLRTRNRLQDREEEPLQTRDRLTLRDQQERPDRPDRPEGPDRPDQPDRPDRFNDGAVSGPSAAGDTRRDQLTERQAP